MDEYRSPHFVDFRPLSREAAPEHRTITSPVIAFCYWLPSRVCGVILTGVLLAIWFPAVPGFLIVLITAAFGLYVWRKTRRDSRLSCCGGTGKERVPR